jgi:hypothetical protein
MQHSFEHQATQFAVNAEFESFSAPKHACTRAALLDVYEFVPERVDSERYSLKCKDQDCSWYLHASSIDGTDLWQIQKSIQTHTCHGINHSGHCNIDEEFISTEILPYLRSDPKFTPKAIQNHLKDQYGVDISYHKAYRAKERVVKLINGSHEDAYNCLPKYCNEIQRSNPGSTVQLDINPTTNQFQRLFICFAASALGFAYCRPVLGIDGTHLKHKYQGTNSIVCFVQVLTVGILLAATAIDANGSLFPLAHAVVDAENHDNWLWFLQLLLTVVQSHALESLINKALVFLSDRQKGLLDAVRLVFPDCPHGYCLKHLEANFHKEFKNSRLKPFLWKAASATTQPDFDKALEDMRAIDPKAITWLLDHAKPEHWAEIYFPGHRYGHLTSNIAESLNSWLLEAREKPILAMFEQIRHQLMGWFTERRILEDKTQGLLVAKSADYLQIVTNNRARRYRSQASIPGVLYEVKSLETCRNYIVDIVQHTCTCSLWQSSGYPCGHAISILLDQKQDPQRYVKSFFTLAAYKMIYARPIFPLDLANVNGDAIHPAPTVSTSDNEASESEDSDSVLPPSTRRQPGRPPKRRIRGGLDLEGKPKRIFKCSRCGDPGHSRRTCRKGINAAAA